MVQLDGFAARLQHIGVVDRVQSRRPDIGLSSPHAGWSRMRERWHNIWVEGEDDDIFLALLAMLVIGAIAVGIALLLMN